MTEAETSAWEFIDQAGFENEVRAEEVDGITEFYGWEGGSYERSLLAVFKQNGRWFVVQDSHCSCNGYESWSPLEFDIVTFWKGVQDGSEYVSWLFDNPNEIRETIRGLAERESAARSVNLDSHNGDKK